MKKTRLSIALMTSLLGVCALAGCDPVEYSPEGKLISYTIGDDTTEHVISAEQIFEEYYNDSDKYQSIFDAIKSIVVRNYFTIEENATLPDGTPVELGVKQLPDLEAEANKRVSSDEHDATTNANKNSTSYDKEFEAILKSKGVKTREELFEQYLDEEKSKKFDENYYKYFLDEIKEGSTEVKTKDDKDFWTGYFADMLPYHVSHILINVGDSSETNYYNGTVTEENCEKLYEVVTRLQNGESFKSVAHTWSNDDQAGDSSSKELYGDLGIMDYNTSYVNEFKLGIYAFENLFGNKTAAQASNIDIPGVYDFENPTNSEGLESQFFNAVNKSFGITAGSEIPSVNIDVFKQLLDVKDVDKNLSKDEVMENSSLVYPRNIIYNKYLNRHSFALITGEAPATENFGTPVNNKYPTENATGLHKYDKAVDTDYPGLDGQVALSTVVAGKMRPILMVRAGGANYQGIHFIIVDRSAFEVGADFNGVTREEYYTTNKIPSDPTKTNYFPKDENGVFKKTYANFSTNNDSQVNSRIDTFVSTIKSYNSDKLSKFIFKKYMKKEGIKISDSNLDAALERWINTSIESEEENRIESWETTWADYIGTLRKQNSARNSLVSEVCKIGFQYNRKQSNDEFSSNAFELYIDTNFPNIDPAEKADLLEKFNSAGVKSIADLYNLKGAPCNDGKAHK